MKEKRSSWLWQLQNSITTYEELTKYIQLTPEEEAAFQKPLNFPFSITPYFLSLINTKDKNDPIRLQVIPRNSEEEWSHLYQKDFLCENKNIVAPHLVQRYPNKVALITTESCATYCRHCTRRRMVGRNIKGHSLDLAYKYLRTHSDICDVLITGGDPFVLPNESIFKILQTISEIPHVHIVRIGTRVPVTLPMRITKYFARRLASYGPLFINIHCNHPYEITSQMKCACDILADAGIVLGSQTVLLKAINDSAEILRTLFENLLEIRVKPYYLYQCDLVRGCKNFTVSPVEGMNLINSLQGKISGLAIPKYVIDLPDSIGKVAIAPNGLVNCNAHKLEIQNGEGRVVEYIWEE